MAEEIEGRVLNPSVEENATLATDGINSASMYHADDDRTTMINAISRPQRQQEPRILSLQRNYSLQDDSVKTAISALLEDDGGSSTVVEDPEYDKSQNTKLPQHCLPRDTQSELKQQQNQQINRRSILTGEKDLRPPSRPLSDVTAARCSESQSSASSCNSTRPRRQPSEVTFDGDTAGSLSTQIEDHELDSPHSLNSCNLIQPTTQQSTAPFATPQNVCRTSSGASGGASSEEDSVAEMDYMSENSNVSVAAKDLTTEEEEKTAILHCVSSANRFSSARGSDATTLATSSSCSDSPTKLEPASTTVNSRKLIASPSRKLILKSKEKTVHKGKTSHGMSPAINGINVGELFHKSPLKYPNGVTNAAICSTITTIPGAELNCPSELAGLTSAISGEATMKGNIQSSVASDGEHRAMYLPKFRDPNTCMWTASHAANCPSEDRSASLVNLLLQPLPPNFDSETQLPPLEPDYKVLIRLNLWSVIDGHGGGCVATYGSEVLLPHIAASVSRALGCAIVDRGVCTVNGQLRDANALDLDGLIQTQSDRGIGNPNSIHYRSPYERSDSDVEEEEECDGTNYDEEGATTVPQTLRERKRIKSLIKAAGPALPGSLIKQQRQQKEKNQQQPDTGAADASVSSVKTSVKTAASPPVGDEGLVGTHSSREVAAITRAITESFLAVDEAWINSIDPVATHQTSCQSNGRWNSGACALVVFTVQRLVWTSVSEPDREKESMEPEKSGRNTTQNRDAARRRMLDYATRTKSASSMSTVSSTSSLTTEEAVNASGIESEITETEGEDDDRSYSNDVRKRDPICLTRAKARLENVSSLISPPGGCLCHCYRAHSAMIYTAHVGDCRAVMLGSAPPRTIKVGDFSSLHQDTTDDESSHHSSDETECLSSSDHDADSSEEEELEAADGTTKSAAASSFMNFPRRVARQRNARLRAHEDSSGPFIALPPLAQSPEETTTAVEFDFETDLARRDGGRRLLRVELSDSSSTSCQDSIDLLPLVHLPPVTRPIDLTTDHSAYNPAEVTAVLRRCNNAPRAISAGVGGGIKRVAGSLAVTRALGDAYLKTPLLSFLPYKSHAPYITARPEVNCRLLLKEGDKVLILATDGVWERASGEDILRWVRNFYEERLAEAVRRANRRSNKDVDKPQSSSDEEETIRSNAIKKIFQQQEGSERDLFEHRNEPVDNLTIYGSSRKRENASSPIQNSNAAATTAKRRRRSRYMNANNIRVSYNVADVIVRRVLNKVRRARNISSLQALMSLPQGRARRSKHDDITASVVDLSAFVS